jgi:hypothetical protein
VTEANATAANVTAKENQSEASAAAAASSEAAAAASENQALEYRNEAVAASGAVLWVAGTSYAIGDGVVSPTNFKSYRDNVGGVSNTDPANDSARWLILEVSRLEAIAATKAVTAVDVFVYDTSKDSDGGAWRKRTQGTSWYNETLNTATRGSRKDFPAVAVIVAEAAKITIYDADDPALPMWRVEPYAGLSIKALAALNAAIWVATTVGLIFSDYAGDDLGTTEPDYTTETTPAIINNALNAVAMTVLPNAPIDPATGLPVPTIRVGTPAGISIIKDDGTVTSTAASIFSSVSSTSPDYDLWSRYNFGIALLAGTSIYAYMGSSWYLRLNDKDGNILDSWAVGDVSEGAPVPNKLTQIAFDPTGNKNHLSCGMTAQYNSGWMPALIKGAWLASTDDTDLVGSGELVTNGDFGTDTDWTKGAGWTISGGVAVSDGTASNAISQAGILTVGKTYVVSFDIVSRSAGFVRPQLGTTKGTSVSAVGSYSQTVTSLGNGTFYIFSVSNFNGTIDNVSVKLADADRSVNNKGLIVNGTVTRTPVATGADLVGYSGFSASNYLEQPYNPALDFGTGDFCVMGWVRMPTGEQTFLMRDIEGGLSDDNMAMIRATGNGTIKYLGRVSGSFFSIESLAGSATGQWAFFCVRKDVGYIRVSINAGAETSQERSQSFGPVSSILRVGARTDVPSSAPFSTGSLALLRISATAPTAQQIAKIYNDEKVLFRENAQATLYGSSDSVTALAHDDATDLLHVGTSAGRSVFQGLRRVSNTTTAVGTAISASNGLVVEE